MKREKILLIVGTIGVSLSLLFSCIPAGASSTWYSIYFTPEDRCDQQMVELINSANSSIYADLYSIKLENITNALINAYNRSVDVRIVTDNVEGNTTQYLRLKKYGIIKTDHKSYLMHNKFIIIDNKTVWTGSFNPTPNGTFGYNNAIVIDSTKLAEYYISEFNEMWGLKCSIEPNCSVKVHTGCGDDNSTDVYWHSGSPIWNNDGDTAFLRDNKGNLVARYTTNQSQTNFTNASYTMNISDVQFDTPHDPETERLNEEWVKITNYGNVTIDMSDWTLSDEAGHTYYFSSGKFGKYSPANTSYPNLTIDGAEIEVYFAPEDHAGDEIIKEIEAANHTIYFETFVFTHYEIEQAIIERNKTGVNVKGIFERDMKYHSNSTFQNMTNSGINVIWDGCSEIMHCMHNKIFIIDNKTIITGSFNPSEAADTRNDENVLIIHNKSISDAYVSEFDKMWNEWQPTPPEKPLNLYITEVFYDTPGKDSEEEWVELYNPTTADLDISGLILQDNVGSWELPSGTVISAKSTIIVARDRDGFLGLSYGFPPNVSGMTLALSNTGDVLKLMNGDTIIDLVAWEDYIEGWDIVADTNESIQRTSSKDTDTVEDWSGHMTPNPWITTPIEPKKVVFDTGEPQNPYPSICGTHNGTITPNQTITVTKLYTYPCIGTGGHSEYVKI
jgi:phosphatidylserine/phosphatidylglycerophosphate/cardiolipin synthase-like enzyme